MRKEGKAYNGAKTVSSINGTGKTGLVHPKKKKWPLTYAILKNNLKIDRHLNVSLRSIKILEEIISSKIADISFSNIFANISPRTSEKRKTFLKMGLHQIKNLLHI